jgi:hypothetical protein
MASGLDIARLSPNETLRERSNRFQQKPWWNNSKSGPGIAKQRLLQRYAFCNQAWSWGYFIYRTTYTSDEDLATTLAKLDRDSDAQFSASESEGVRIVK